VCNHEGYVPNHSFILQTKKLKIGVKWESKNELVRHLFSKLKKNIFEVLINCKKLIQCHSRLKILLKIITLVYIPQYKTEKLQKSLKGN